MSEAISTPQRRHSTIVTGSDLNHRTFGPDESWNSLQSTVLAGNLTMDEEYLGTSDAETDSKNLSTLNEEDVFDVENEDVSQDPDVFNMNIARLLDEDDEAFFDCPSYSPKYSPKKMRKSPTFAAAQNCHFGQFLTIEASGAGSTERTGSMLAQMISDFDDLKERRAQSTPNIETDDNFIFSRSPENNYMNTSSKRKISFSNEEETRDGIGCNGPESSSRVRQSPSEWRKVRRVAKMTEFFESKISAESRARNAPKPSKPSKIPKLVARTYVEEEKEEEKKARNPPKPKSPSYRTRSVAKRRLTPSKRSQNSSWRRNASCRPASCSEYNVDTSKESGFGDTQRSRSRSDSDLLDEQFDSSANMSKLRLAMRDKRIVKRSTFLVNSRITAKRSSPRNESVIKGRRSVALQYTKSPIKPVKVLRNIFSPRHQMKGAKQVERQN